MFRFCKYVMPLHYISKMRQRPDVFFSPARQFRCDTSHGFAGIHFEQRRRERDAGNHRGSIARPMIHQWGPCFCSAYCAGPPVTFRIGFRVRRLLNGHARAGRELSVPVASSDRGPDVWTDLAHAPRTATRERLAAVANGELLNTEDQRAKRIKSQRRRRSKGTSPSRTQFLPE